MNKLIATIKYGSAKTKAFLALVFVLLAGGLALSIYGIASFVLWALAAGALMLICGLIMIFAANFTTEDIDKGEKGQGNGTADKETLEHGNTSYGRGEQGRTTGRNSVTAGPGKNTGTAGRQGTSGSSVNIPGGYAELREDGTLDFGVLDANVPETDEGTVSDSGRGKRRNKKNKSDNEENEQNEFPNSEKSDRIGYRAAKPVYEVNVDKYDEAEFRHVIRLYKVKRHFTPIVIDDCPSFRTSHTPALVWTKKNLVNFLLLEGNERVTTMPLERFLEVGYEQNVSEDDIEAYNKLRTDMGVYEKFSDVMPTFTSSTDRMGRTAFRKNRYILGHDLAVTPRSLKALREKFNFKIKIFDALDIPGEFTRYFKGAYEARILWTDGVIGQTEYQNRISGLLQMMVDDKNLSKYDFLDELEHMVEYRLITNEYADYYNVQRQKRDSSMRK